MADLNYDISVSTKDALSSINSLKTALGGLATAFAIREVVQFADGITNLRNKLLTLTPELSVVNKQFSAIAAIALTSRTPLESTADLFFRIQRASKALGISQQEVATITESLTKALSASGLSAGEAAGPLLQLGQALQSGVFQGDELRSILEGLPVVAQALADELGVPVGQLKKLGSEGQISADVFVRAMRRAKDSIDEAFGRTTPTITSALESLRTNSKIAFDEFEKNTKTGQNLAASIEYLGFMFFKLTKNIDEFAGTIATILKWTAIIVSFTLVGKLLFAFIGIIKTLGVAIFTVGKFFYEFYKRSNELGKAIAGLGGPLRKFTDAIVGVAGALLGSGLGKLAGWIKDSYNAISGFFDRIGSAGDATSTAAEELKAYREELAKMKEGLDDTAGASENQAALAKELAKTLALARLEMNQQVAGVEKTLKQTQERLALENEFLNLNKERTQVSEGEIAIAKMLTDIDIERRNTLIGLNDQLAKMQAEYGQLVKQDSQKGKEMAGQIAILKEQIKRTGEVYDQHAVGMARLTQVNQNLKTLEEDRRRTQENIVKSIESQISRNEKLGDILRNINDQTVQLTFETNQIGLGDFEKQLASIQQNARKAALEAGRSFSAAFEDSGDGLSPEQAQEFADGLARIAQGYQDIANAQIANLEASRSWQAGWQEAFANYAESAFNAADQAKTYFETFTRGFEDAIVRFVQTGKLSFKDLANSIIADFARMQAKRIVVGLFGDGKGGGGNLFGNLLGNLFGGGRAAGGAVQRSTAYMVGERGPELFMPTTAGTIIPNNMLGGQSMPAPITQVTYNIQAVDAASFRSLVARDPQFLFQVTEKGRRSQPTRSRT